MNESLSVTELLHAWREGDRSALDQLVPLVYANLRGMAASHLRREAGSQTLDPTALVHEAYLRLVGDTDPEFQNRAHFLGVASRVMRQILVDRARSRNANKRQAGARVPFEEEVIFTGERASMVVALDDALLDLERQDPEKARLLELKYFGGMTAEDSSTLLGVPLHKINRQMKLAQAWLRRELDGKTRTRQKKSKDTPESLGEDLPLA
ncbi:MAG: ECF-type sigma factor [Bryobacteraceae bacterium]